jgi:hypothetical protein
MDRLPELCPRAPDSSVLSAAGRDRVWDIAASTATRLGYRRERLES